MFDQVCARRQFLKHCVAGAVGVGAVLSLTNCKKDSGQPASTGARTAGGPTGLSKCADVSGLNESQLKTRESLKYVDETPQPPKRCDNCMLYIVNGPAGCGGCKVLPGPVMPGGWCSAWAPAPA